MPPTWQTTLNFFSLKVLSHAPQRIPIDAPGISSASFLIQKIHQGPAELLIRRASTPNYSLRLRHLLHRAMYSPQCYHVAPCDRSRELVAARFRDGASHTSPHCLGGQSHPPRDALGGYVMPHPLAVGNKGKARSFSSATANEPRYHVSCHERTANAQLSNARER